MRRGMRGLKSCVNLFDGPVSDPVILFAWAYLPMKGYVRVHTYTHKQHETDVVVGLLHENKSKLNYNTKE